MSEYLTSDYRGNATKLIEELQIPQDQEFFSNPTNRVEFLSSLDFQDFFNIAQHVNARLRGYEPREKKTNQEQGGYLPLLKTPDEIQKPLVLKEGFEVIKTYLQKTRDNNEEKVKAAGMAVEALIVWVHPFADGNGRTSRFLGTFIEDGTTDVNELVDKTTYRNQRMRWYGEDLRLDNTTNLNNEDILLDDQEKEEIRKDQDLLPITEGIPISIKRLLEDKKLQEIIETRTKASKERHAQWIERLNAA